MTRVTGKRGVYGTDERQTKIWPLIPKNHSGIQVMRGPSPAQGFLLKKTMYANFGLLRATGNASISNYLHKCNLKKCKKDSFSLVSTERGRQQLQWSARPCS